MEVRIKKVHPKARLPEYEHESDAGMDLFAAEDAVVPRQGHVSIPTGLVFEIPERYVGLIWPKSGLAAKHGIVTLAGVIDSGYRGEVQIVLASTKDEEYTFKAGEKVAQMLIQKIEHPTLTLAEEITETARGEDGFGSTGK